MSNNIYLFPFSIFVFLSVWLWDNTILFLIWLTASLMSNCRAHYEPSSPMFNLCRIRKNNNTKMYLDDEFALILEIFIYLGHMLSKENKMIQTLRGQFKNIMGKLFFCTYIYNKWHQNNPSNHTIREHSHITISSVT